MRAGSGAAPAVAPAADWVTGLIPSNPIRAAADTAVAPLVLFSLVFGLAVTRIAGPLRASVVALFQAVTEAMLVIVRWVLWLGPVGVLALAFRVGAENGAAAFGTLLHYIVLVSLVTGATGLLAIPVAVLAGRIGPAAFCRAALPAQIVALSTQSSLASLPAMIQAAPALGAAEARAGVVLPLAVSLFRAASAAANVAVAVYVAHLYGAPAGPWELAIGVLVAAPVSLAAVGLPAQVSYFATTGPVCLAMGAPLQVLPILLAVETIPDIFRTIGNVTADLAVTRIVGRGGPAPAPQAAPL
jgi:Na+/H+-dicarboxylate symporter